MLGAWCKGATWTAVVVAAARSPKSPAGIRVRIIIRRAS
jgi:hypothetical protein